MTKTNIFLISLASLLVLAFCSSLFIIYNKTSSNQKALTLFMRYYNQKTALFEEENKTEKDIDVVFLGDSITDGYPLKEFYPEFKTLNRGIGGDTTFGLENRLKVSAYDANPKVVVMLIGGNNMDTMFLNYETIVSNLEQNLPNSKIVLISLTSMGKNWAHKNTLAQSNNKKIKQIADEHNLIYVDMFTPLYDNQTKEINSAYTEDGVHPNEQGYEVMTKEIKLILSMLLHKV